MAVFFSVSLYVHAKEPAVLISENKIMPLLNLWFCSFVKICCFCDVSCSFAVLSGHGGCKKRNPFLYSAASCVLLLDFVFLF
jgi:hypothetical protein